MSKRGVLGVDNPTHPTVPPMTGEEWDAAGRREQTAFCPICDERLSLRAARSPQGHPHFAHLPNSGCPTVADRRIPFEELLAGAPRDPEAGRALRAQFVERCYETYLNLKELAPGLSIHEFRDVVARADALRVWDLEGMTMQFVPYVLALCVGEFPQGRFRGESFYFVFAKRHPRITDLWNAPGVAVAEGMWRVYPADQTFEFEPIRPDGLWVPGWVTEFQARIRRP